VISITENVFGAEYDADSYGGAIQIRIYCAGDHAARIAGGRPVRLLDSDASDAGDGNGRRGNAHHEHAARQYPAGTDEWLLL
jgi:hypothetical protein